MSTPSDGALVPAQATQDIAWLRTQLAPAREPLARLTAALPSVAPISSEGDAVEQSERISTAEQALADIEACVAPTRSRIHAMRTELSRRVKLATEKAARTDREGEARARRVASSGAGSASRPRPRNARMAAARSETLAEAAAEVRAAPEPTGAKGTRRQWKMEVRNEPALRASMLRLVLAVAAQRPGVPAGADDVARRIQPGSPGPVAARALVDAIYVNEGVLRKALANAEGAHRGRAGRPRGYPHLL